jgi:hypothetical protein
LLDSETLREYLAIYRGRTDWLCEKFPVSTAAWKYFEWSFWLSMVEKITGLGLADCAEIAEDLRGRLATVREEFMGCEFILDFEKDWVREYIYWKPLSENLQSQAAIALSCTAPRW